MPKTAINPLRSGRQCENANILFNEGAQRSFILKDQAAKLKVTITVTESVNLSSFGDSAERSRKLHLKTAAIYLPTDYCQCIARARNRRTTQNLNP